MYNNYWLEKRKITKAWVNIICNSCIIEQNTGSIVYMEYLDLVVAMVNKVRHFCLSVIARVLIYAMS